MFKKKKKKKRKKKRKKKEKSPRNCYISIDFSFIGIKRFYLNRKFAINLSSCSELFIFVKKKKKKKKRFFLKIKNFA